LKQEEEKKESSCEIILPGLDLGVSLALEEGSILSDLDLSKIDLSSKVEKDIIDKPESSGIGKGPLANTKKGPVKLIF
jgi:hypothetical protein